MSAKTDQHRLDSRERATSSERARHTLFGSTTGLTVACVAAAAMLFALPAAAANATSGPAPGTVFSAVPGSAPATALVPAGVFSSPQLSIEVVLAPRYAAQLSALLAAVSTPGSASYGQWLKAGQFDALFAPAGAQVAAVDAYLRASGLTVEPSSSPFLVRATGSSSAISTAFRTSLNLYSDTRGGAYFANASAVQLPAKLAAGVMGVVGLTNTVRVHPHLVRPAAHPQRSASCEAPYATIPQLYAAYNNGTSFPFGYGAGPGCNGLTPAQDNSIYGAPAVGSRGKGAGVDLAVFELSAYQHADITAFTGTFYGSDFKPPLVDILVDGGPLHPACPRGDSCPAALNGYSGDIEVDADIETQLAIAPDAHRILVYNAPNDTTGQTELDEYARIADDDVADVVSSSWGACEDATGAAYALAENVIFEQMALQGQSMFASAGDNGAFDCLNVDHPRNRNTDDPSSQPWVTSVGGTSFYAFNPGVQSNPAYPAAGESVWNVEGLCNTSADEGSDSGYFWCGLDGPGAGGGGNSEFWGRPFYQTGPGITNRYTAYGNRTSHCTLAAIGTPCREVPDISADADEFTPYAEYCTANANTPNSSCAFAQTPFGWFGIGGTSLSSPLWSGIFADRDSYQGHRSGNANPLLYALYDRDANGYFHDVTGIGQIAKNNGYFPTTAGYDLATGIGTPRMAAIITDNPQR